MTLAERYQWAYGFAALVTSTAYFIWLGVQLASHPAPEVDYAPALLWTVVASVVVHTFGRGAVRGSKPASEEPRDERDREVDRRADALCFPVFSILAAVPLLLGLAGAEPFWITNALFAAFSLTAVLGVAMRAVFYRHGIG